MTHRFAMNAALRSYRRRKNLIIYILRHGTTEWNNMHRIQGNSDTVLDDLGREMAVQTGEYFKENGIRFDRVFASPLKRAYETATIVAESEITVDQRLRELDFGRQEGQIVEEMLLDDGVPFKYFRKAPDKYDEAMKTEERGESLTQLCERAADFLRDRIEKGGDYETVLIAGHGALNKALLMHIRGEKDMAAFWGEGLSPNCGAEIVEYDERSGSYSIISSNNVFYDKSLLEQTSSLLKE